MTHSPALTLARDALTQLSKAANARGFDLMDNSSPQKYWYALRDQGSAAIDAIDAELAASAAQPGTVQWCEKCGEGVVPGMCRKPGAASADAGKLAQEARRLSNEHALAAYSAGLRGEQLTPENHPQCAAALQAIDRLAALSRPTADAGKLAEAEPLIAWLEAKWHRHGEIEDKQAAELLAALARPAQERSKIAGERSQNCTNGATSARGAQGDERAAFEGQFAYPRGWRNFTRNDGGYYTADEGRLQAMWTAWQARAQVAQGDEVDAARLDWLEGSGCTNIFKIGNRWYTRAGYQQPHHRATSLRDAIDAARAQQGGQG